MAMYSKIMVPYDGSDHAKHALEYAQGLAGSEDVKICIVHVVASGSMGVDAATVGSTIDGVPLFMLDYEGYRDIIQNALDESKKRIIELLGDTIDGWQDRITVEVVAGSSAADALARYALQNDVDLVVMGRRGLGAVRGMLGSVSFGVLRAVDCPVLTVK